MTIRNNQVKNEQMHSEQIKRSVILGVCVLALSVLLVIVINAACVVDLSTGIGAEVGAGAGAQYSVAGSVIVNVWYVIFAFLIISGILLAIPPVRRWTGIKLPQLSKPEKWFVLGCFIIYLIWMLSFVIYSYGADEWMRKDVPEFIFRTGNLPYGWEESIRNEMWGFSYGFNIDLPYLSSAFFMRIVGCFTQSEAALLYAARFPSVLFGTGVAYLAVLIAKKFYKENPIRWIFLVGISMLPQVVYLASYVNLDIFSLLTVMIIIYSWLKCLERKWDYRSIILLAIGIGLCALGYEFAFSYILMSLVLYVVWFILNRKEFSWKKFLVRGLVIVGIVFLICGWKYVRNAVIYDGDVLARRVSEPYAEMYAEYEYKPSVKQSVAEEGTGLLEMVLTSRWMKNTYRSLIGRFGYTNQWFSLWVYAVYLVLFIVGLIGMLIPDKKPKPRNLWLFRIAMVAASLITVCVSIYYSWTIDFQAQGRYIIAALPCILFIVTSGLDRLVERREKRRNRRQEEQRGQRNDQQEDRRNERLNEMGATGTTDMNRIKKGLAIGVCTFIIITMMIGYSICINFYGIYLLA